MNHVRCGQPFRFRSPSGPRRRCRRMHHDRCICERCICELRRCGDTQHRRHAGLQGAPGRRYGFTWRRALLSISSETIITVSGAHREMLLVVGSGSCVHLPLPRRAWQVSAAAGAGRHPRRSKGHGAPGTTIRPMLELACESRDEGALGTSDFGGPLRRLFIVIAHWYDRHSRAGRCVADFGRGD